MLPDRAHGPGQVCSPVLISMEQEVHKEAKSAPCPDKGHLNKVLKNDYGTFKNKGTMKGEKLFKSVHKTVY